MTTKPTKTEVHKMGVEYAAMNLIENGISTTAGTEKGIDLILNNGKTILVRAMSNEDRLALTNGSLDYLKADYLIIVTNLKYISLKHIYIMTMDQAKDLAVNNPYKVTGRNDYFIDPLTYRKSGNNTIPN